MSWVDERLEQRKRKLHLEKIIQDGMNDLWQSLQAEFNRCIDAYNKGQKIETAKCTTATPDKTEIIVMEFNATYMQDKTSRSLTSNLDRTNRQIKVHYQHGLSDRSIQVGTNGKEQACLLDESGAEVSIEEVAKRILDPLFFNDLPPS